MIGIMILGADALAAWSLPGEESRAAPKRAPIAGPQVPPTTALALPPLPAPNAKAMPDLAEGAGPQQIGIAREIPSGAWAAAAGALRWIPGADGFPTAAFTVRSPDAAALRVALTFRGVPHGSRLTFSGSQPASALEGAVPWGPNGAWGPITAGDTQYVEVAVPPGTDPRGVHIGVESVSHLLSDPTAAAPALPGAKSAGSCQQDVACAPPSEALQKAMRSVVKIVYTADGATFACTGTLVSDAQPASQVPYILTAKHCIDSPAKAATVNTYWFLEAASCGGKSVPAAVQLAKGARLLHAGVASDVALIELNEPAPAGAWFAGIEASPLSAGESAYALHHPSGDLKKLSSGRVINPAEGASGRFVSMAWLSGSTEPGSSGSGLFTETAGQYVLRGTLRGGSASCSNSGDLQHPANRDFYERLDADIDALKAYLAKAVAPVEDYTDLWIVPQQPGTGISVTQHASNATFIVWFFYDRAGQPTWIIMPGGTWTSANTFSGPLYRARRPGDSVAVEPAGSATFRFTAPDRASVSYTLEGQPGQLLIERQLF